MKFILSATGAHGIQEVSGSKLLIVTTFKFRIEEKDDIAMPYPEPPTLSSVFEL